MTAEEMHARADELRKEGDAAGWNTATGKRLLRECRRWRLKARQQAA